MSGTRNFKRLGAPGHYINVRFDDAHVRLCRNGRGGPAIKNRGFDKTHSSELFDVKEGELLLGKKLSHTRDGYAHCFSSLNGYPGDPANPSVDDLRKKIFNDCVFIGVANTPFSSEDPSMEQGFTAQVGGVVTLKHMGHEVLHPGDLVRIDISSKPLKHTRKGIPPLKELLVLRKASNNHTLESLGLGAAGAGADDLVKAMAKESGRVIGKAMSLARSGDSVDILLFHRSI